MTKIILANCFSCIKLGNQKLLDKKIFYKRVRMYKVSKKACLAVIFSLTAINHIIAAPAIDEDLDSNRAVVRVEKEIRDFEKELEGKDGNIPEKDRILVSIMVRKRLSSLSDHDLSFNRPLIKAIEAETAAWYVALNARQHAANVTRDSAIITNAFTKESTEFMALWQKGRRGNKISHYFGKKLENRVNDNIRYGNKYYY
jgi:hypothetical protein